MCSQQAIPSCLRLTFEPSVSWKLCHIEGIQRGISCLENVSHNNIQLEITPCRFTSLELPSRVIDYLFRLFSKALMDLYTYHTFSRLKNLPNDSLINYMLLQGRYYVNYRDKNACMTQQTLRNCNAWFIWNCTLCLIHSSFWTFSYLPARTFKHKITIKNFIHFFQNKDFEILDILL